MKQSQTGRHGVEGPGVARIGQVLGITLIIVLLFWMVMGATPTMASSLASKVSYGSLPAGSISGRLPERAQGDAVELPAAVLEVRG